MALHVPRAPGFAQMMKDGAQVTGFLIQYNLFEPLRFLLFLYVKIAAKVFLKPNQTSFLVTVTTNACLNDGRIKQAAPSVHWNSCLERSSRSREQIGLGMNHASIVFFITKWAS